MYLKYCMVFKALYFLMYYEFMTYYFTSIKNYGVKFYKNTFLVSIIQNLSTNHAV